MKALIISSLATLLLKCLAMTYRFQVRNVETFKRLAEDGLLCPLWHNRLIGVCVAPLFRPYNTVGVISFHKDGEILVRVQKHFGHRSIRGSSTRGGHEALLEMENTLRQGSLIAITPDGPKGPRYQAKPGAAILIEKTGRPALPLITVASRRWKFNSWDGFELPHPFAEVTLIFGNPVGPTGDIERTRANLEEEMRRMVVEGEALYGRSPDFV